MLKSVGLLIRKLIKALLQGVSDRAPSCPEIRGRMQRAGSIQALSVHRL